MTPQMTSKQRLLTAARCEEPDRVPVAPSMWHLLRKWYGNRSWPFEIEAGRRHDFDPMPHLGAFEGPPFHSSVRLLNGSYGFEGRSYCEDMAAGVTVDVRMERHEDHTLVWRKIKTPAGDLSDAVRQALPPSNYGFGDCQTTGWVPVERTERLIKGPEDVERVRFLLTMPTEGQLTVIRKVSELIGEDGLLSVDCMSPVDYQANAAMSLAALQGAYHSDRSLFDAVIDLFWGYTMELTRAYLEAGAEMVAGCWYDCGESDGWSAEQYREVFLPRLTEHVELTHEFGALYEYNEEGKVMGLLPMLQEAGIDVLKTLTPPPVGDADLAEVKRTVGDSICLRGYIDGVAVIEQSTPAQIEEAVREAILTAAPGGGFIIGSTQPITVNTPDENVRAYFRACREYGDYRHLGQRS